MGDLFWEGKERGRSRGRGGRGGDEEALVVEAAAEWDADGGEGAEGDGLGGEVTGGAGSVTVGDLVDTDAGAAPGHGPSPALGRGSA